MLNGSFSGEAVMSSFMSRMCLETGKLYKVKWAFDVLWPASSGIKSPRNRMVGSKIVGRETYMLALKKEKYPKWAYAGAGSWTLWNELKLWIPEDKYMYLELI